MEVTEQETDNQVVERFCRFLLDYSPAPRVPEDDEEENGGGGGGSEERPYDKMLVRFVRSTRGARGRARIGRRGLRRRRW